MISTIILLIACYLSISNAIVKQYHPTVYPEYCSKHIKDTHKIEPLSTYDRDRVEELVQVHSIIRHGARTPWTALKCWRHYDVPWSHCNVTELMVTSPSSTGNNAFSGSTSSGSGSTTDSLGAGDGSYDTNFIFRKLYDGSRDLLGGDCLTGQLISEGYEQERDLGHLLYDFYLNNKDDSGSATGSGGALNLFPSDLWNNIDHRQVSFCMFN